MPKDDTGSVRHALARLLDAPQLAEIVAHFPPETLHRLIHRAGLDACGEIVALATPAQLASVFDVDLWRQPRPGQDEYLDADRFGEWLELLAEAGPVVAARTIAAMGEGLAVAGLSRHVRVFDRAALASPASSDDEFPIGAGVADDDVECEVGGYVVRAVKADAWDAIVSVLFALGADAPDLFHAVMRGCRALSNSPPEMDGLDDLLQAPDQALHEVAVDREERRSQRGYSTAADSRAFLQMARVGGRLSRDAPAQHAIVAAYFRAVDDAATSTPAAAQRLSGRASHDVAPHPVSPEALDAVAELLAEDGLVPRPLALLDDGQPAAARLARLRTLMAEVRDTNDAAFVARVRELAFLINTLAAGGSIQFRSLTPQEASEAVLSTCNLGLELWHAGWPEGRRSAGSARRDGAPPHAVLFHLDMVTAFEMGWETLHRDVCLYAAQRLAVALADLRCDDADVQRGVDTLRFELTRQCEAGTPWLACGALDALAMIDVAVWAGVSGLIDQCPVIPAALTATLEGRTGPVSATAFEFISTPAQLDLIRTFVTRLPALFAR